MRQDVCGDLPSRDRKGADTDWHAVPVTSALPRLVVAGISGGGGKTIVSLGLLLAARRAGLDVRAFKKGPDYIDAAWLTWASGHPARNLDSFLMGFDEAKRSFERHACLDGLNVIEGNRGLYDGVDGNGTHSTAELAKALRAPVVLVLDCTKQTRTAAACLLGCRMLDPGVQIAGVILNRVNGARHERVLRDAIRSVCDVPVLGVIPKIAGEDLLPERHLGLVTPSEHPAMAGLDSELFRAIAGSIDLDRLLEIGRTAPPLETAAAPRRRAAAWDRVTIGYLKDAAFTFYYPDNLEALEDSGADLRSISALNAAYLPEDVDLLYIGGGFPETHAARLSGNSSFLASLRNAARRGLPIYAECGGLMLLSRAIRWGDAEYPMAGVLPFAVEMCTSPQGHGYSVLRVDRENPYFAPGTSLRGHEFHYSRIVPEGAPVRTACAVERGSGSCNRRGAIIERNIWASYTHLHALATPEWAAGLVNAARRFRSAREVESEFALSTC